MVAVQVVDSVMEDWKKNIVVEGQIEIFAPVHFNEGMIGWKYGVLGRKAVFESLVIAFREYRAPYIYIALENKIV